MKDRLFTLKEYNRQITNEDIVADLKRVAVLLGKQAFPGREYARVGKYALSTVEQRIGGGSWNNALRTAGLRPYRSVNLSVTDLHDNIREVWLKLERQPTRRDIDSRISRFSSRPYVNRFGTWSKALQAFVEHVNEVESEPALDDTESMDAEPHNGEARRPVRRRTSRHISDRLRFAILLRDGFRCQSCGSSPITTLGTELHVDHIVPWSKGGETEKVNLQVKCSRCNLGKGNAFDQ